MRGLNAASVIAAAIFALLAIYAKSARWSLLLPPTDQGRLSARALFPIVLVGQLVNNGLPLRAGELVRIEAARARGVSRVTGASTIVVEKLAEGLALAVTATLLSAVAPLPDWLNRNAVALGAAGAAALVAAALLARPAWRALERPGGRWRGRVRRLALEVLAGLAAFRSPRLAVGVLGWTASAWAIGLLVNVAALQAIGAPAPLGLVLLTTVGIYAGGLLPSPPGRLGIFQYTCVLAAEAFGVDPTAALAYAAVEYVAVVIVPSALGALVLLVGLEGPGRRPAPPG